MSRRLATALVILLLLLPSLASRGGEDHFLTIGGGGSPRNNQLSLERNVVFFRHTLADCGLADAPHDVYFACGNEKQRDLQYLDDKTEPPRANLLLARLLDRSEDELYQNYRAHDLPDVKGPANRKSLNDWFATTGARLADGDRLFIYFTGHGGGGPRQAPRNTTMDLWLDGGMPVKEFVGLLDKLSPKVQVVLIMVQCHSGGFGDVIFKGADVGPVLAESTRCGFFATWCDRLAAGCTPDTAEENYKDYTTYFFAALSGRTRMGQAVPAPDYDHDGRTSMAEAHAYVLLTSDTIDIPMTTSDVLLRQFSKIKDAKVADLVTPSTPFEALLKHATPDRRAVLEGLSKQLELKGDDRAASARALADSIDKQRKALQPPGGGGGRRGLPGGGNNATGNMQNERDNLRNTIRARLIARWPEMNSPYHPLAVAALAKEPDEIVKVIESAPGYKKWDDLVQKVDEQQEKSFDLERKWVKCQRFLYVAETVALEANLPSFGGKLVQSRYEALRKAENGTLGNARAVVGQAGR
jgi:hypothetical protein